MRKLVHTRNGPVLNDWHPSPYAFNHVILRIEPTNAPPICCDPTLSYQRGSLQELHSPAFGKGLLIREGETNLTVIPGNPSRHGYIQSTETITTPSFSEPARFEVEIDEAFDDDAQNSGRQWNTPMFAACIFFLAFCIRSLKRWTPNIDPELAWPLKWPLVSLLNYGLLVIGMAASCWTAYEIHGPSFFRTPASVTSRPSPNLFSPSTSSPA